MDTKLLLDNIQKLDRTSLPSEDVRAEFLRAAQALCSRLETPLEWVMRHTWQEVSAIVISPNTGLDHESQRILLSSNMTSILKVDQRRAREMTVDVLFTMLNSLRATLASIISTR